MAISREKKESTIAKLGERLAAAETVVFVNFHGLAVNATNELRRTLRGAEVGYMVAKKTLIRRALEVLGSKVGGEMPDLPGEVAVVTGQDQIAPARGIHDFAQKLKEGLKILGGIFEGQYVSAEKMEQIAAIPSREVMYGQFVNIINSPIAKLVICLNQINQTKK